MNKFHSEKDELIPRRSTENSAGYDFIAPKDYYIPPHGFCLIESEVSVELDPDKVLMCYVRSSYGFKYGIVLSNGTGVIDSDFYPNKIKCKLWNTSDNAYRINKGDKYMQGVIMQYFTVDSEKKVTNKRTGGIGSTDSITEEKVKATKKKSEIVANQDHESEANISDT